MVQEEARMHCCLDQFIREAITICKETASARNVSEHDSRDDCFS